MKMLYSLRNFSMVPTLTPRHLPSPMETHLWFLESDDVKSESLLNDYMELLSPSEKQNVLGFRSHDLQKRALLSRALLRTTIARYQINYHSDPRSLKFKKNLYGKPEVDWCRMDGWIPPPLHFNISHTSSLVACGVTVNSPIGIDVEEKHRRLKRDVLAFAQRYFTACELEYLSGISNSEVQQQEFIKLWTLKEAYVKALGRGFSAVPFKTFSISVNKRPGAFSDLDYEASEITVEHPDQPESLQFSLVELTGSHYAAVCQEKDGTSEVGMNVIRLTAWKTIPFVEDNCISGTDAIVPIGGSVKMNRIL